MTVPPRSRSVFFAVFALSGFSGLIYESIWTHYLKLFLGHAAYAQTLVLAIFMGGMAIGSWLCSRGSGRWKNLMKAYAIAEGVIGLLALLFHEIFTGTTDFSYACVIPALTTPALIIAYKWLVSTLLILPQSILLGMTFPLMSAALIRLFPESPGKSVALLYFTNSIGAAAGVLASGFVMVRLLGLPGTVRAAGVINIALALFVWLLNRTGREHAAADHGEQPVAPCSRHYLLLGASLVTGAASFIYEIGWIRMLSLVLGSSTHAFELMLSAFIFGLACGGLFIQRRIDRIAEPLGFLGRVQVLMGLLALSTLITYGKTFAIMQWLVRNLDKSDSGYTLFNLSSSAIAIVLMLPATFFAGMTLPLITLVLMREGGGERSIGAVYAWNTVGAIIGVFFAIHLGLPLLGLKGLLTTGAALDMGLGLVLLWKLPVSRGLRIPATATVCCVGAVALVLSLVELDLYKMGSGVYRNGILLSRQGFRHLFHKDGKTATVDVFVNGLGSMRINTNGKTDATVTMDPERSPGMDESTMTLLAAIPMALHPQATTAASIGLGSGMTTQILLDNPQIRKVDTVEIEEGMVEGAKNFRPLVESVYADPRSRIYIDDAKTFFSARKAKYDIIISEPSNPWVSGVSGLFSEEFYRLIKNHMADHGLFVQWVQLYEIDTTLVCSVLKAVSDNFADFAIYGLDETDLMIVASKDGKIPAPETRALFLNPAIDKALKKIQVRTGNDIEIRKVGDRRLLRRLLASLPIRANSDYYPVLDQNAARARFLNSSAQEILYFAQLPFPTAQLLTDSGTWHGQGSITPSPTFPKSEAAYGALALGEYLLSGRATQAFLELPSGDRSEAVQLRRLLYGSGPVPGEAERLDSLFTTAENILPYLPPAQAYEVWQSLASAPNAASLSGLDRECLSLFKAMARRDGAAMAGIADALLRRDPSLGPAVVRFLTASGMLGHLMQGETADAGRLWNRYRGSIFGNKEPDLLFRLLAAESSAS